MAIELERLVRGGDPRIRQVDSANYSDYVAEAAIVSTTGYHASLRADRAPTSRWRRSPMTGPTTKRAGASQRRARAGRPRRREAPPRDAIRRATRMLGAVKPAVFKCTAVFDPRTAATLFAIIGGPLSGEAVVRGRSFFANRVGEMVAAPSFTLLDDPTDPRHFSAQRLRRAKVWPVGATCSSKRAN